MTIKLGQRVVDQITGFSGIATALVSYITGCNQVCVQPQVDEKGSFVEARYIDEDRLIVDQGFEPVTLKKRTAPGFGTPPPVR